MEDHKGHLAWFMADILPHQKALKGRLRRAGVPASDLDDFAAEALARAYAYQDWRRVGRGKGFLFHIARNLVVDAARRRCAVQFDLVSDMDALELADAQPSPETIAADRQRLDFVRAAIADLPPIYREILRLRRIEEASIEETAARLGVAASTVEKRLAAALILLKSAIAKRERALSPSWRAAHGSLAPQLVGWPSVSIA